MRRWITAALVLIATQAIAEGLSVEQIARVQLAEQEAIEKVSQAYGNRPSSELSTAERRAIIREQQSALAEVHATHGVDPKVYARTVAKLDLAERKEVADKAAAIVAAEKAAREKKGAPAEKSGDVEVYEGLDDSQLEQLDEPLPPEGEVQIMLPGQTAPDAPTE